MVRGKRRKLGIPSKTKDLLEPFIWIWWVHIFFLIMCQLGPIFFQRKTINTSHTFLFFFFFSFAKLRKFATKNVTCNFCRWNMLFTRWPCEVLKKQLSQKQLTCAHNSQATSVCNSWATTNLLYTIVGVFSAFLTLWSWKNTLM